MATRDPRAAEWGVFAGATPPPSWPPADARLSWLGLAVLGLLCGQMLLLAILAWEVLLAPVAAARSQPAPALAKPSPSREAGGPSAEIEQRAQEIDAQTRVLDRVLAELGRDGPDGAVRLLQEAQAENEQLKADARVYRSLEARVNADNARLGRELAAAESEVTRLRTQVAELSRSVAEHEAREREHERQIAALQQPPDSDADAAGGGSLVDWRNLPPAWLWGGGAATLAVLIAIGWGWGLAARRAQATGERDHATAPDGPAEA